MLLQAVQNVYQVHPQLTRQVSMRFKRFTDCKGRQVRKNMFTFHMNFLVCVRYFHDIVFKYTVCVNIGYYNCIYLELFRCALIILAKVILSPICALRLVSLLKKRAIQMFFSPRRPPFHNFLVMLLRNYSTTWWFQRFFMFIPIC